MLASPNEIFSRFHRNRRAKIIAPILIIVTIACAWMIHNTKFTFYGDMEGLFILKGEKGYALEVTDDLFPDGVNRLLVQLPTEMLAKSLSQAQACEATLDNCLEYQWNENVGRGYILNRFGDGRKLLMCFSRFKDDNGMTPSGIFIGGGMAEYEGDSDDVKLNETGMAYFDGTRWYHIWCSVNEAIASGSRPDDIYFPSQWKYLRSRVLEKGADHVTITSTHELTVEGVPLQVNKYLFYHAGEQYFTLVTQITNVGTKPTSFYYTYGDEPWLGNYGTSGGNVGWREGAILNFEGAVDPVKNSYVGMFDYGNSAIGEQHNFTGLANFIEWREDSRPDMVYFSNSVAGFTGAYPEKIALSNPTNRFVGLQWGPKLLKPGQGVSYTLAIGMANNNPMTGFPVKPPTSISNQ